MITRLFKTLFGIFIIFSITGSNIHAQSGSFDINALNLGNINIEQISDDQVRLIVEKMEQNGISQQQFEMAALARGMSSTDLQKLLLRMNTVKTLGSARVSNSRSRTQLTDSKQPELKAENILPYLVQSKTDSISSKDPRNRIFGFSLFNNAYLTFEPSLNMPTPVGYILGPGDELIIDVWGASQNNYNLAISPEGNVFIDNVGITKLGGLTIEEATNRLRNRLSSIYAGLRGASPNTYMQVSVGSIRSIKVNILGEVNLPGTYTLSSLATAFNALYVSGGPNFSGSMRHIKLIRGNGIIDTLDVYDLMFNGNTGGNSHLKDQDIILVEPYSTRVAISGEVKRPLIYEMKIFENLNDLLRFSGGFKESAYKRRIKIYRNTDTERKIIDLAQEAFNTFAIQNGDSVVVERVLDRYENRVEIKGAVYRPGFYSIGDGLTLSGLLEKAEGLKGDAFRSRGVIYRTMDDFNLESQSFDLEALQNGQIPDPVLKKDDIVVIPSIFDLQEEYYVQIDGEIRRPGKYPYMFNSTVEDVIIQAGGLLESASMAQLEIARRVKDPVATTTTNKLADIFYYPISNDLRLSDAGMNMKLEPFDRIFIRRSPGYEEQLTVVIEGEVFFPGKYSISNKDERISDIIQRAGGLTSDAYPEGASLTRVFSADETDRRIALESAKLLRQEYWDGTQTGVDPSDPDRNTASRYSNILQTQKLKILDSLLLIAVNNKKEQAIGIDLVKILSAPHSKHDLIVQEGDVLSVPKLLQTVGLSGALLHPITVRYDKRYGFKYYISSAGGFSPNARRSKSYIIYANGSVDITHSFLGIRNYPKPGPGAEIVVPVRDTKRRLTTGEVLSLSSAVTSMALVVVTLINRL